ncbi:hypothetical protein QOZ80_8BG0642890 [Eleusine coracana subsp. coracana]|nr:hypothetical protein QOZ80_8BG0642890 [Eleusine coracana subsp. coracana]
MMLYDAAHLRTHGEQILDNIITFNKSQLQSLITTNLEPDLANEVRITLETPRFRRVERIEAQHYISVYEKKATRDETILKFAKLDYNILQALYCEELKELTIWWMDFKSRVDLTFARDRMVELHFWMLGIAYEPHCSFLRIMMTKFIVLASLLDDLYDNYCTTNESNIFTETIERWDEQATEHLPSYLKEIFINILNTTNKVVKDLELQRNKHAKIFKEVVISTAKFYHAEVK